MVLTLDNMEAVADVIRCFFGQHTQYVRFTSRLLYTATPDYVIPRAQLTNPGRWNDNDPTPIRVFAVKQLTATPDTNLDKLLMFSIKQQDHLRFEHTHFCFPPERTDVELEFYETTLRICHLVADGCTRIETFTKELIAWNLPDSPQKL